MITGGKSPMKPILAVAALMISLCGGPVFAQSCDPADGSDTNAIAVKAQELTKDKSARIDKLMALHTFVRDEVALARTQYG
jgi:hypothetical protein